MLMKWLSRRGEEEVRARVRRCRGFRPRLEALEDRLAPANIVWSGAGADAIFSNDANWVGGVAPGINDTAIFDPAQSGGAANANKNGTINAPANVQALLLQGAYTGTVTALAPYSGPQPSAAGLCWWMAQTDSPGPSPWLVAERSRHRDGQSHHRQRRHGQSRR